MSNQILRELNLKRLPHYHRQKMFQGKLKLYFLYLQRHHQYLPYPQELNIQHQMILHSLLSLFECMHQLLKQFRPK